MMVKIIIKRRVSGSQLEQLTPLLGELHDLAVRQPGYISGEMMRGITHLDESLVISAWQSFASWEAWFANSKRISVQSRIDVLLGSKTEYAVYEAR